MPSFLYCSVYNTDSEHNFILSTYSESALHAKSQTRRQIKSVSFRFSIRFGENQFAASIYNNSSPFQNCGQNKHRVKNRIPYLSIVIATKCNRSNNRIFLAAGFTELIVPSIALPRSAALLDKEIYNRIKHLILICGFNRQLIACKCCSIRLGINFAWKSSGGKYRDMTAVFFQLCLDHFECTFTRIIHIHTAYIDLLWNYIFCCAAEI